VTPSQALTLVRRLCLSFPETSERASHGAPTFFVREKRSFVTFHNDHHGDGRLALWCAAPIGVQEMLVDADPAIYFVPPYVGYRGWLGVRLDGDIAREALLGIIEDAYACVAPKSLLAALGSDPEAA
jgi:hypothetical protein